MGRKEKQAKEKGEYIGGRREGRGGQKEERTKGKINEDKQAERKGNTNKKMIEKMTELKGRTGRGREGRQFKIMLML